MSLTRARRQRSASCVADTHRAAYEQREPPAQALPVVVRARIGRAGIQAAPVAKPRAPRRLASSGQESAALGEAHLPHWQQSMHWFWFGEADTSGIRTLVVPLGETYEQGPHLMTRFRTQDGRIQSCSVEFFERNTERCRTMRRLAA